MNQVIGGLRTKPDNYFHYVVGDIIWSINQYLMPPPLEKMLDEIIQQVVGAIMTLKYVDTQLIRLDFQTLLYQMIGIGPTEWMYSSTLYVTVNAKNEWTDLYLSDPFDALHDLVHQFFQATFPCDEVDEFICTLDYILRDYLLDEVVNSAEFLAYRKQLEGAAEFVAYKDRWAGPEYNGVWDVPLFMEK